MAFIVYNCWKSNVLQACPCPISPSHPIGREVATDKRNLDLLAGRLVVVLCMTSLTFLIGGLLPSRGWGLLIRTWHYCTSRQSRFIPRSDINTVGGIIQGAIPSSPGWDHNLLVFSWGGVLDRLRWKVVVVCPGQLHKPVTAVLATALSRTPMHWGVVGAASASNSMLVSYTQPYPPSSDGSGNAALNST